MSPRFAKFFELLIGRRDPPAVVARFALGVGIPIAVVLYGLSCIVTRHAKVIARGGLTEIIGLPAVSTGIAYETIGIIIYVYVCWDDHPRFAGLRDAALQLLLVVVALALAATFGLALI